MRIKHRLPELDSPSRNDAVGEALSFSNGDGLNFLALLAPDCLHRVQSRCPPGRDHPGDQPDQD
jgi:hypothetical protein